MRKVWLLFGAVLFVTGCLSTHRHIRTEVTYLAKERFAPAPRDPDIYFGAAPIKSAFEQLAFLEVYGSWFSTSEELFAKLKARGKRIGADAIISVEVGERRRRDLLEDDSAAFQAGYVTGVAVRHTEHAQREKSQDSR
jgi:hypothetical protein